MTWKPRKKRVSGTEITYKGVSYPSIVALHRGWDGEKPSERTLPIKLLQWKKKNPNKQITDEVVERLFQTRTSKNSIIYKGHTFNGPRDLFDNYKKDKVTYGGFWMRLKEFKKSHPNIEQLSDEIIDSLISPSNRFTYQGKAYKNIPELYSAIAGEKISLHRFANNIRNQESQHPTTPLTDDIIEKCVRFMSGEHAITFRGIHYPNLKSLFDAQPQPKTKWVTFAARVRKITTNQNLSDDLISNLLTENAKVAFFKGILYKWTHKTSGKIYIGISSMPLSERIRMHVRQAKDGAYSNPLSLQAAIAKDGLGAFIVEVISEFEDEKEMLSAEDRAIREHKSMAPHGFNLRDGGLGWTKQGTNVEFEGVIYPSYSVLARKFGISEKLLDGRRRWGWSLRDALMTPLHTKNAMAKSVEVAGKTFHSIRKAAEHYGVSHLKVHGRLERGWSIEDALELTDRASKTRIQVTIDGITYESLAAAARKYGKDPKKVWAILDKGKSIHEALGLNNTSLKQNDNSS